MKLLGYATLLMIAAVLCLGGCEQNEMSTAETGAKGPATDQVQQNTNDQPAESAAAKGDKESNNKMSENTPQTPEVVHVVMKTSMGEIKLELNREKAPVTVDNFIYYVKAKFYDGLIFHRIISDFMIQGGGFTEEVYNDPNVRPKTTKPPIKNEADNRLSNRRGTIAMARTRDVNSATSQFFINTVDNYQLDYKNQLNYGYAVFGKVVEGMDVVDAIRNVPLRKPVQPHVNLPAEPVVILSITVLEE